MGKNITRAVIFLATFLCLIYFAEAQQTVAGSFFDNLKSGAISNSIGEFGKNSIFLWYTTVGGELNPQYDTQRKFLDFFIYSVFFFIIVRMGVKTAFKDRLNKANTEILSLIISFALSLSLVMAGISLGGLLPFVSNIGLVALAGIAAFFLTRMKNKDGKQKIGTIPAILIAAAIILILMNGFNLFQGKSLGIAAGTFNTERPSDFSARIISGGGASASPAVNYQLALAAVQQYQYEKAQNYFLNVIDAGPSNNPYYQKTAQWITIREGDKLFKHMAENYPVIMSAEESAAEILIGQAEKEKDPAKRKIQTDKASGYIEDILAKKKVLDAGFEERNVTTSKGGK